MKLYLMVAWSIISLAGILGVMIWCLFQESGWIPGSVVFICGGGAWATMVAYFEQDIRV